MADSPLPSRFRVLEEISRDDAEILLRARDELPKREVMIRYPRADRVDATNAQDLGRALRQARALARVQHPGVIRLLDVLETESGPALVVEPVVGETLREVLAREQKLTPEHVRTLALDLCAALEAVHAAGVVHRGLSATNIVLRPDGSPCLTGFVFAKFGPGGTSVHATTFDCVAQRQGDPEQAVLPPTPPHPAPEQILGQPEDARADVFGLGWVLYECLTGKSPYPFDHDPDRWPKPGDPRCVNPAIPKGFSETVLRCLHPSPLKRIGTVRDVRVALEARASEAGALTLAVAPVRSMRGILVTTGILVALGVISTTLILRWKGAGGDQVVDAAEESRGILPREKRGPLEAGEAREYSDRYDQSRALLIGIGEPYGENAFPVLPNAERDVTALGKRLRTISSANDPWSVEMLLGGDATHDRILERLGAFTEQAGDNDKVLVYYAGHGARHEVSENSGWIIPADGLAQERDPNRKNGLRFDEFGHLFDESRSKPVLVAMDCCYGGRLITPRSISRSAYSRRLVAEPAKIIISSGRPNEQVSDGVRGENSPFARAFLEALSRPDVEAVTTADIVTAIHNRFLEEEVSHLPVRVNPPERHSPAKSCSS